MLQGIEAEQLTALGKYRAVMQTPTERSHQSAIIFDTYPPWTENRQTAEEIKEAVCMDYPDLADHTTDMTPEMGTTANAGGEFHAELLKAAQDHFITQGAQVNLLYQDAGDEKPDGTILRDSEIANLEAEHSTLTKPVKVLTNYKRAVENGRECVFVVERGQAMKLDNILTDPVNRRGTDHEDEDGTFAYYRHDGEAFTDVELVDDGEYRIFEVRDDETLVEHDAETDAECPELEHNERESLESFCIYRDESEYCSEIGQQCVFADD
jgi:hypothetical protein